MKVSGLSYYRNEDRSSNLPLCERKYKVINKREVKSGILASDCTHQFARVKK